VPAPDPSLVAMAIHLSQLFLPCGVSYIKAVWCVRQDRDMASGAHPGQAGGNRYKVPVAINKNQ